MEFTDSILSVPHSSHPSSPGPGCHPGTLPHPGPSLVNFSLLCSAKELNVSPLGLGAYGANFSLGGGGRLGLGVPP
jgi:hypothetical protein